MIELTNTNQIRVRYAETDKMGVVYNANYFVYFETGRNELMRKYRIPLVEFERTENIFFPLIDAYAKYLISAQYDDLLTVETKFIYDGSLVYKFESKVIREGILLCEGYTRHCFISQKTMKPTKPPKGFIDVINSFVDKS
jgi:acyl-CoA thioester hydrolase